jgi:dienelactone hydrolase
MTKFRRAVLGDSDLSYAVAIAHYPGCAYSFVENSPSRMPIRIFLAEKDDYTGVAPCLALADFLKRQGYDVSINVYANNNHAYDEDVETTNLSRVEAPRSCEALVVNLDEPGLSPIFAKTGARLSPSAEFTVAAAKVDQWASSCMSRGARVGYNPRADVRQKSVDDTLAVLRERFAMK